MIVRTAAEGASIEELERDVRLLEKLWETTRGHAERAEAPALVYVEPDLSLQMIRDDLRSRRLRGRGRRRAPVPPDRVLRAAHVARPGRARKLYKGKRPLFQRYEIEQGIRSTLRRRVDLPSGGYLIFDYAEAFTIVDVNTGRFTGKRSGSRTRSCTTTSRPRSSWCASCGCATSAGSSSSTSSTWRTRRTGTPC